MSSVLYLGALSGTSFQRCEAFSRLGHSVTAIDPRRLLTGRSWVDRIEWNLSPKVLAPFVEAKLRQRLEGRTFDLCWIDNGSLISYRTVQYLRKRSGHVVNFNHDDPFGLRDRIRFQVYREAVPYYDLLIVVRESNVAEAIALGARSVLRTFMTADEVAHQPKAITSDILSKWKSEVAFIGTWMPERGPFMAKLVAAGIPLAIYGGGWEKAPEWHLLRSFHRFPNLTGNEYAYAIQCADISLGLLSKGNRDQHTTRSMEIPYLGGLLCAERTPEHMQLYDEGIEAVFWDDAEECAQQCFDLLSKSEKRKQIAKKGQLRAQKNGITSEAVIARALAKLR
jgi:hypothetical protein